MPDTTLVEETSSSQKEPLRKIIQPNIERPDNKDPYAWAKGPIYYANWMKEIAPQLDLNPERLVLGFALHMIRDNTNCFFGARLGANQDDNPNFDRLRSKQEIELKIGFELTAPNLPNDFRRAMQTFLKNIQKSDWNNLEQFNQDYNHFLLLNKTLVSRIDKSVPLLLTSNYYYENSKIFDKYYIEFKNGQELAAA